MDPASFHLAGNRAVYRPVANVTFEEAVALVREAIVLACQHQARELLVDSTRLTGFLSPDTLQRFFAAIQWAEAGAGRLHLAMVALSEMIDPQKFAVTVAANRGLVSNIFPSEAEAVAWLDETSAG